MTGGGGEPRGIFRVMAAEGVLETQVVEDGMDDSWEIGMWGGWCLW